MSLNDLINMLTGIAEIAVTVFVAYAVFKVAKLIESLDGRIMTETVLDRYKRNENQK